MKYYFSLAYIGLCLIFPLSHTQAQNQKLLDSLETLLPTAQDTQRVKILNKLCWENRNDNFKKSLAYINESIELARKIRYTKGLTEGINFAGTIHRKLGNYNKAMSLFFECLKLAEKHQNLEQTAYAFNNIGEVYTIQLNYPSAESYILKSLAIFEKMGDKKGIAYCYIRLGETMQAQKRYDKALEYFQKCAKIRQLIQDKRGLSVVYTNIGEIYHLKNNFSLALDYTSKALALRSEKDKGGIAQSLVSIARIYQENHQYSQAIAYALKGLRIAKEIHSKKISQEATQVLSNTYAQQKDFSKAFQYQQWSMQLKDSLFQEESNKTMMNLKESYETAKKEAQISLLTESKKIQEEKIRLQAEEARLQARLMYIFIAGSLIFLILSVLIFIGLQKQKRQKKIISNEQQKSEKLLLNILPRDVANELKEKGITEVRHFKQASVLFADVKGFSALATRISPQELIKELDYCFGKFDEITNKYSLERIKTIGDCYMCAGGVPNPSPFHAINIVLAALEMQQWMTEEFEKRTEKGETYWQVRLGINSGELVAGVIGKTKFAYDIWGNTVNTAARLESAGEVGRVLITEDTFAYIRDFFDCTSHGKIEAKNIGLVETYFVNKIKPELSELGIGIKANEDFWTLCRQKFELSQRSTIDFNTLDNLLIR